MSSYLNIYLEKKPKEGEKNGERLLLCSITRSTDIYTMFYDNRPGIPSEEGLYSVTDDDLVNITHELERQISTKEIYIYETKLNLSLIKDKEAIDEILDNLKTNKEYLEQLKSQHAMLMGISMLVSDVGEDWCDFSKIYWRIE